MNKKGYVLDAVLVFVLLFLIILIYERIEYRHEYRTCKNLGFDETNLNRSIEKGYVQCCNDLIENHIIVDKKCNIIEVQK